MVQRVKNLLAILEMWVQSLGWKIPSRRAWQRTPVFLPGESPWTEESGGLQCVGSELDMTERLSTAQHSIVQDLRSFSRAVDNILSQVLRAILQIPKPPTGGEASHMTTRLWPRQKLPPFWELASEKWEQTNPGTGD